MKIFCVIRFILEVILTPILFVIAIISRLLAKKIDIGIGPEPIVSHKYQKMALQLYGYTAETYVNSVYFITEDFDIRADLYLHRFLKMFYPVLLPYLLFVFTLFRYSCIYIYFNGGPLLSSLFLWRLEPFLYKLALVKIVVMPYGSDIQELGRCNNLMYKNAFSRDYPQFRVRRKLIERRIDLWTTNANHVISGCDWVEYMYHWDTLVLAHFTIDTDEWKPIKKSAEPGIKGSSLKILHAPNHPNIKGTHHFLSAVEQLKSEGYDIEILVLQRVPHEAIKDAIASADIIADQLIIGWYGMFAVEAMAMGKPVLCFIRDDFENLFIEAGIIEQYELPIIRCNHLNLKEVLKNLLENKEHLEQISKKSRAFAEKYHSIQAIGKIFDSLNRSIGIIPQKTSSCIKESK